MVPIGSAAPDTWRPTFYVDPEGAVQGSTTSDTTVATQTSNYWAASNLVPSSFFGTVQPTLQTGATVEYYTMTFLLAPSPSPSNSMQTTFSIPNANSITATVASTAHTQDEWTMDVSGTSFTVSSHNFGDGSEPRSWLPFLIMTFSPYAPSVGASIVPAAVTFNFTSILPMWVVSVQAIAVTVNEPPSLPFIVPAVTASPYPLLGSTFGLGTSFICAACTDPELPFGVYGDGALRAGVVVSEAAQPYSAAFGFSGVDVPSPFPDASALLGRIASFVVPAGSVPVSMFFGVPSAQGPGGDTVYRTTVSLSVSPPNTGTDSSAPRAALMAPVIVSASTSSFALTVPAAPQFTTTMTSPYLLDLQLGPFDPYMDTVVTVSYDAVPGFVLQLLACCQGTPSPLDGTSRRLLGAAVGPRGGVLEPVDVTVTLRVFNEATGTLVASQTTAQTVMFKTGAGASTAVSLPVFMQRMLPRGRYRVVRTLQLAAASIDSRNFTATVLGSEDSTLTVSSLSIGS